MTVKKVKERGEKHYVRRHYVGRRRSNPNFDPDEHNFMVVTSSGMDLGTSIVNTLFLLITIIVALYVVLFAVEWVNVVI